MPDFAVLNLIRVEVSVLQVGGLLGPNAMAILAVLLDEHLAWTQRGKFQLPPLSTKTVFDHVKLAWGKKARSMHALHRTFAMPPKRTAGAIGPPTKTASSRSQHDRIDDYVSFFRDPPNARDLMKRIRVAIDLGKGNGVEYVHESQLHESQQNRWLIFRPTFLRCAGSRRKGGKKTATPHAIPGIAKG